MMRCSMHHLVVDATIRRCDDSIKSFMNCSVTVLQSVTIEKNFKQRLHQLKCQTTTHRHGNG